MDEQKAYMNVCSNTDPKTGERYGFLYLVTLFTGMRLGEVIGLKWEYIDFEENTVSICETIKRSKVYKRDGSYTKENVIKGTKTSKGNKNKGKRTVPIPSFLITQFKQHRLKTKGDYVFCTSTGTTLSADNIRKYHHRICEKAKIKSISFHALRHTYATRLIEHGENFKTVQELLGHADIKTTLNIYTHVLPDTKKSTADKLETLYTSITF